MFIHPPLEKVVDGVRDPAIPDLIHAGEWGGVTAERMLAAGHEKAHHAAGQVADHLVRAINPPD
jgi:hypothetical protein